MWLLWLANLLGKERKMIVFKITITYLIILAMCGIAYSIHGSKFMTITQIRIENVFAWAVAVLAVGSAAEILYVIWKWL